MVSWTVCLIFIYPRTCLGRGLSDLVFQVSPKAYGDHDSPKYMGQRWLWLQDLPISTGRREKSLNYYLTDNIHGSNPLQVAPDSLVEWELGCTTSQPGLWRVCHSSPAPGERGSVALLQEGHLTPWCSLFPLTHFIPSLISLCFLFCRMNMWGLGSSLNHLSPSHPVFHLFWSASLRAGLSDSLY